MSFPIDYLHFTSFWKGCRPQPYGTEKEPAPKHLAVVLGKGISGFHPLSYSHSNGLLYTSAFCWLMQSLVKNKLVMLITCIHVGCS